MALSLGEKLANGAFSPQNRERFGLHYLGISLVLAWYYCLWFSPNVFSSSIPIVDDRVTYSWLITLGTSGISFLIMPLLFRKVPAISHSRAIHVSAAVLCAATLVCTLWDQGFANPVLSLVVFPLTFGICNAIIWVAWSGFHARKRSAFTLQKFAFCYGATMLVSIIIAEILPHGFANLFVALLPLACSAAYTAENARLGDAKPPTLLPKATRAKADKATLNISIALFIACMVSYYTIAIIPVDDLIFDGADYAVGMILAAALCVGIAGWAKVFKRSAGAYRLLPLLLVACSVACALFASGYANLYWISFTISVVLAGIFEVFMISYFGSLSSKGHLVPATAFGLSSAVVRLGFLSGDALGVVYENDSFLYENFPFPTAILMLVLLAAALIPLLRQESVILQLTSAPVSTTEIDEVCEGAIQDFSLSKREGEILKFIARGYTIDSISKKLVISPYTTQTHVRHIYSKMNVHKRSELVDYLNMHRFES